MKSKHKVLIEKLIKIEDLDLHFEKLNQKVEMLHLKASKRLKEAKEVEEHVEKIIQEKSIGFPWISDVIAEYFETRDMNIAEFLDNKLRPAATSAQRVRELAKEKRRLKKKFLVARNFVKYYESLFPWLQDFVDEDIDNVIRQITIAEVEKELEKDPVRQYVSNGEYQSLSTAERNQRALKRYWQRRKSSWEIGRDYERYAGYCYEKDGYKVSYQGIEYGLADLGRDLICTKQGETKVVQCKYWSKKKKITEKHINQLFGTTVKYIIDKKKDVQVSPQLSIFSDLLDDQNVEAVFMTTTELTATAKKFANALGISIVENDYFDYNYPCIKCNISRQTGDKIYHLPFDQQYDKTVIEFERGEFYAKDVTEAEEHGFRRAWRWTGSKD